MCRHLTRLLESVMAREGESSVRFQTLKRRNFWSEILNFSCDKLFVHFYNLAIWPENHKQTIYLLTC